MGKVADLVVEGDGVEKRKAIEGGGEGMLSI